jgi:hypothetical protein
MHGRCAAESVVLCCGPPLFNICRLHSFACIVEIGKDNESARAGTLWYTLSWVCHRKPPNGYIPPTADASASKPVIARGMRPASKPLRAIPPCDRFVCRHCPALAQWVGVVPFQGAGHPSPSRTHTQPATPALPNAARVVSPCNRTHPGYPQAHFC